MPSQNKAWPNVWAPHGPVKMAQKMNYRNLYGQKLKTEKRESQRIPLMDGIPRGVWVSNELTVLTPTTDLSLRDYPDPSVNRMNQK